jgi:hypothetical protein
MTSYKNIMSHKKFQKNKQSILEEKLSKDTLNIFLLQEDKIEI